MPGMRRFLATLAALLLGLSAGAMAAESNVATSPRATVSLVSEAAAVAPGQPFRVMLQQVLQPGWHTYWTNPGDAGQATELELALPPGASATPLRFPTPQRIPYGPLVNFGYEGRASFPLAVTPPAALVPGERFHLEGNATWLVCEQVCIPEEAQFRLDLPVEAAARLDPAEAAPFAEAEAALPRASPWSARAGMGGGRGAVEIEGQDLTPAAVRSAFFFPAEGGWLDNTAPQPLELRDGAVRLGLAGVEGAQPPQSVAGVVVITDAAGSRSGYEVAVPAGPVPASLGGGAGALGWILAAALLGGLILNLMPCVFPVLAMKAIGLARLSGAPRRTVRLHALSYTLGVLGFFALIGALLGGLRTFGVEAGWGYQFTRPAFVAVMAWVMLLVGLNLLGVFRLNLSLPGIGPWAAKEGQLGSFLTGGLAVLIATPCTAPFMATAMSAAMVLPGWAGFLVFLTLGLGMALPYLVLACVPGALRVLPRPGAWMERLQQFLAFPMFAAAAWLVWVLTQQTGADGAAVATGGAVLIGFATWLWGWQGARHGLRRGVAALAVLGVLGSLPLLRPHAPVAEVAEGQEPWSRERLAALRAEGRPVFVNLTAAWCITCKVNDRVAIDAAPVREAFAKAGVVSLVGDWTSGDPEVGRLLREQGRDGVPLYLFYGRAGEAPAVLPQVLTQGVLLRAVRDVVAAGPSPGGKGT
ncbi:protein-disulfide reductase DsbD family protein [Roseomonas elaeocarpi]|uniref:Protein-disulfide reductase DsbD family protein n=1 Tax=Roseomonas elaeocarpi TaxID=907779 RepID=A0ABV6JU69_9PROT